jgi:hypothetical protein
METEGGKGSEVRGGEEEEIGGGKKSLRVSTAGGETSEEKGEAEGSMVAEDNEDTEKEPSSSNKKVSVWTFKRKLLTDK